MRLSRFAGLAIAVCTLLVFAQEPATSPSGDAQSPPAAPAQQTQTEQKPAPEAAAGQAPAAQAPAGQAAAAGSIPKLEKFDTSWADKSVDPCQDFYKYSCGKWESQNPIPSDQVAWGTGSGLDYWNESVLRETMEKAAAKTSGRSPTEQKIGDYWAACMDEPGIQKAGTRDLNPELQRIERINNKSDLPQAVAHLHSTLPGAWQPDDNQTNAPLLGFDSMQDYNDASKVVAGVDQAGMGLPGRDFYLQNDAKSTEIRNLYLAHVTRMLELSGERPQQAAADANAVLSIETAMAQAAMDNVKRRDPRNVNNPMSFEQVQALTPSFNWKSYLSAVGAPAPLHYVVSSPDFFRSLDQLIRQRPLPEWKAYLRWQMVHGSARFLSKPFVDENFNFYSKTLLGAKEQLPRWRRCVRAADRDLGEALGQAYVARAFPAESKQRSKALVNDVENALHADIQQLDWMAPQTKKEAAEKLRAIEDKVGYPNHWRDYSSVRVGRNSYLNNVHQATAFEFQRQLNKIGKPVDRSEWTMTPPTINAYYDPQLNTINFPAGILQPPYFAKEMDDAANYGAIGGVIGHEIIHGFDDQGRKFDAQGNLRDWWTPADARAYDQRGDCIAHQYTQEVPAAGVKQNGRLTQGEDTADNGGIHLAYMALAEKLKAQGKSLDAKDAQGWTPEQKFYLAYGFQWCTQYRPELMRTVVLTNPHSIPVYRVNNVVANQPEFQRAFSCKKPSPMVHENACKVW